MAADLVAEASAELDQEADVEAAAQHHATA
jgi:hypothetical protein